MASWKETSGRESGPEGYRFGDFTRSLVGRVVGRKKGDDTTVLKPRRSLVGKKYGWRRDLPDHRDQATDFSVSHPALWGSLPASVDLRAGCAALYNQGTLGSCTANAIAAAFQFDQHKEEGVEEFMPSRLFIYWNERSVEGTVDQDSGAMIRDGIKSVHKLGVCPEYMCPYDVSKFTEQPSAECYAAAAAHTATSYKRVLHTTRQMKACLAAGFPFVFGFTVLSSFESDEVAKTGLMPMPQDDDECLGGHAVCCVGYDDAKQVFIVRNSWGEEWGDGGYFYMPYEYIANSNLASDFWTIRWVE